MNKSRGFTIVELLIYMTLTTVISLGMTLLVSKLLDGEDVSEYVSLHATDLKLAISSYSSTQIQNCQPVNTSITPSTLFSQGYLTYNPSTNPFTTRISFESRIDADGRNLPVAAIAHIKLFEPQLTKKVAGKVGAYRINTATNEIEFRYSLKSSSRQSRYIDYVNDNTKEGNWCFSE